MRSCIAHAAFIVLLLLSSSAVINAVSVDSMEPSIIGMGGGTITILGTGFSDNEDDPSNPSSFRGNKVFFISDEGETLTCSLVDHYTSLTQIVCLAPESTSRQQKSYKLFMSIDGGPLYESNKRLYYRWAAAVTLEDINTRYAASGTPLMFTGRIHSDRHLSTQDPPHFVSAFVGDYPCYLTPRGSDELYGLALTSGDRGYYTCNPRGIKPGYYKASFSISQKGNSKIDDYSYTIQQMNNKQELFIHQAYPVVTSITPSVGSKAGGQLVTIKGQGFGTLENTYVEIGGHLCDIVGQPSTESKEFVDEIICRTRTETEKQAFYPGDNGVLLEVWNQTMHPNNLTEIRGYLTNASDYYSSVLDTFYLAPRKSVADNTLTARARGFLAPMKSGWYTILTMSDDKSELWMAVDGDINNLTRIATNPVATSDYLKGMSQRSEEMYLEAGKYYYMEMLIDQNLGHWYFGVGLFIGDTELRRDDWIWAQDEKQHLRIQAIINKEQQFVNISGSPGLFRLNIGGRSTPEINPDSYTVTQIKSDIEALMLAVCEHDYEADRVFYIQGYEASSGASVNNPYCGRYSAYKPGNLYNSATIINPNLHDYLCMAVRSTSSSVDLTFVGTYTNQESYTRISFSYTARQAISLLNADRWNSACIKFSEVLPLGVSGGFPEIKRISIAAGSEYWVDQVIIADGIHNFTQTAAAASIGDSVTFESVLVNAYSGGNGFFITYNIKSCEYGVLLSSVADVTPDASSADSQLYIMNNGSVEITRISSASKTMSGTFTLSYEGRQLGYDLPWDASSGDVKRAMNVLGFPDTYVWDWGNCYGKSFGLETRGVAGNHSLFVYNTTNLSGPEFNSYTEGVTDGGVLLPQLSNDWFVQPRPELRVSVTVNDVRSRCPTNDCVYEYQENTTPSVISVSPSNGGAGTELTIDGLLFSSVPEENEIRIGSAICNVTSSSESQITCTMASGSGGHFDVEVYVASLGRATGNATFTYDVTILSVSPSEGSTAGGTELMICLDGVTSESCNQNNISISIGDQLVCVVQQCTDDNCVICITVEKETNDLSRRKRNTITYDVVVNVGGSTAAQSNAFITVNSTAVISFINASSEITIAGGQILVLTGEGFGSVQRDSAVYFLRIDSDGSLNVPGTECQVTEWADTSITCVSPTILPGNYSIKVNTPPLGFSESTEPPFEVVLQLESITPQTGSVVGGTLLTLKGQGFSPDDLVISLGGHSYCGPVTVTGNEIICQVVLRNIFDIDNGGHDLSYGLGYAWDPQYLTIQVGDIVRWTWASPPFIKTGARYAVWQTDGLGGTDSYPQGFSSPVPGSFYGTFEHKFLEAKLYHYAGPPVDTTGTLVMEGSINVVEPEDRIYQISLSVNGVPASLMPRGDVVVVNSSCPGVTTKLFSYCQDPVVSEFQLLVGDCYTPIVNSISPLLGPVDSIITIEGSGFGESACQVTIMFGEYECDIITWSNSTITCEINHLNNMTAGVSHTLSLLVSNYGYAVIAADEDLQGFTPLPVVDDVTPRTGSTRGGTRVTLSGNGFVGNIDVKFGVLPCKTRTQTFSELVCFTGDPGFEVELLFQISTNGIKAPADNYTFSYNNTLTPIVRSQDKTFIRQPEVLSLTGAGFGSSSVEVYVGDYVCDIMSFNDTSITCSLGYLLTGNYDITVYVENHGHASPTYKSFRLEADNYMELVMPNKLSTEGGALVTINGYGFKPLEESEGDSDPATKTQVFMDSEEVKVVFANMSQVVILSPPSADGSNRIVKVLSNGRWYNTLTVNYGGSATPTVINISPNNEVISGVVLSLYGTRFTPEGRLSVTIAGEECIMALANDTIIECLAPALPGGVYTPEVITDTGRAMVNTTVEFQLQLTDVSPSTAISFGGGVNVTLSGEGFDPESVKVTVCGEDCTILTKSTTEIICDAPNIAVNGQPTQSCNVTVIQGAGSVFLSDAINFDLSVTPNITDITPRRGGTAGGTRITITGEGFTRGGVTPDVTIDGSPCLIPDGYNVTDTEIQCVTEAHRGSIRTYVRIVVGMEGVAYRENAGYFYADVWSSRFTWGGLDPPIAGDAVIVNEGQTLVINTETPVLKLLLIKGGTVLFDEDMDFVHLQAEYIVISHGGALEIGTAEKPYLSRAQITVHGHVRSLELPIFGAKVLAVRNGRLDLHGRPLETTWTLINQTANAYDVSISLKVPVNDWYVGDQFVIATTGGGSDQYQNEVRTIESISDDKKTLYFSEPLKYTHLYTLQTIDGVTFEAAAEVGLLSRNVKVAGNINEDWTEYIEGCERPFKGGQFARQNCFLGKFGDEVLSDDFGVQIMFHPRHGHPEEVAGRLSFVEVTHAGQSFRLGRYPIHYHIGGDQKGKSYVRGCAIHRTFNRAITMHGTNGLLVEHNVAYDNKGHAYFTEDGVEVDNIIQYNLAIFTRPQTSLLNVDQTPASFWLVNPKNTVRHNHAAGGSHFGFWYRLQGRPDGMHAGTPGMCPSGLPVTEFYNNTAHSFGRYGLWVFDHGGGYFPKSGPGGCSGGGTQSVFGKFFAWNCDKGAETVKTGSVRFVDFLVSDISTEGIAMFETSGPWGDEGPGLTNCTVIGHSEISPSRCTRAGVRIPNIYKASVNGLHLINFDLDSCVALEPMTAQLLDGGFPMQLENIRWYNSPNKIRFHWQHETWWYDIDGTLLGYGPDYTLTPWNALLDPNECVNGTAVDNEGWSRGYPAAICNPSVDWIRWAFNYPQPPSLEGNSVQLSNDWGTSTLAYKEKGITHPFGWMALLPIKTSFWYEFVGGAHFTNITYSSTFYFLRPEDYVIIKKNFTTPPDYFSINNNRLNSTATELDGDVHVNGEWHFEKDTNTFSYIVSGRTSAKRKKRAPPTSTVNRNITPRVYQCFFLKCIPPPPPPPPGRRPLNASLWSNPETWKYTPEGWGGNYGNGSYGPPRSGDDVIILPETWVIIDVPNLYIGNISIYGTLEFDDSDPEQNFTFSAETIWVTGLGKMVAGNADGDHFPGRLDITLRGNHTFPPRELVLPGVVVGRKAIGVFGRLELHGEPREVYWTRLTQTVEAGATTLKLKDSTDWRVGEEIVLATTDFESFHTEVLTIRAVSINGSILTVTPTQYRHIGEVLQRGSYSVQMSAEVGLLTRNIKIIGEDYPSLIPQSFGARMIVGRYTQSGKTYIGSAELHNIEFYHTGQEGFTAVYDPRYSLAYLDVGTTASGKLNKIHGCSFHHGFSPAIGIYGSHGITIQDNVIHHTVGQGIIVEAQFTSVLRNLVTLTVYPGTYLNRFEDASQPWEASIEVHNSIGTTLIGNAVAGSERIGFHIDGESCTGTLRWSGNTVHSVLHGIHIFALDGFPGCTRIANFVVWKAYDYGIYFNPQMTVHVENVVLVDNMNSIMPLIFSPHILSHTIHNKYVKITNSLFVGTSEYWQCGDYSIVPKINAITMESRGPRTRSGGKIGITMTSFLSKAVGGGRWDSPGSYTNMDGKTIVDNVIFSDFGEKCGRSDVVFMPNAKNGDAIHPFFLSNLEYLNTDRAYRVRYLRPSKKQINPSDCVDMDCDGMKKVMIHDVDGTTTGTGNAATIIPDSAFEWNGDPSRGLGDYRIPKTLLTYLNGSRIKVEDIAPYKGIVGTSTSACTWIGEWLAYECYGLDYEMLIIESLDRDTETRRLSPVAVLGDQTVDLINGPMDHGWCNHYTCQRRVSTFYSIIAMNKHYDIHLTGSSPKKMRYHILDIDNTQSITLGLYYSTPLRLDVYRNGVIVYPTNADIVNGKYILRPKDPALPDDQYLPKLTDTITGSNFMEKWAQTLYLLIKRPDPIEIHISDVVIVSFDLDPVPVDEFFEDDIVRNLVLLLGISENQIRVVNVIREDSLKRRKRAAATVTKIDFEIGDEPAADITGEAQNDASGTTKLSVNDLKVVSNTLTQMAQDGSLTSKMNLTVVGVGVIEPIPEPLYIEIDNSTLNSTDNATVVEPDRPVTIVYLIPHHISIGDLQTDYSEYVLYTFSVALQNFRNELCENLARDWYAEMRLLDADGNQRNFSAASATAQFVDGYATFENIFFMDTGRGFYLEFTVDGKDWDPLTSSSFNVKHLTGLEPENGKLPYYISGGVVGGILLVAVVVIVLVALKKKKKNPKVSVDPSLQSLPRDSKPEEDDAKPVDLHLLHDKITAKARRYISDVTRDKFVFADMTTETRMSLSEERNETVGAAASCKLIIRKLRQTEISVYFCNCGTLGSFQCPECNSIAYCSVSCQQKYAFLHQNFCFPQITDLEQSLS